MPSSTSNSNPPQEEEIFLRPIPDQPWGRMAAVAVLLVAIAATAWEVHVRSLGYAPTLNDSPDLWASRRAAVQPDSLVVIGDSRPWFDLDLDEMERGLGRRPIQLALAGGCAYPVLNDLAADENFHGTVICSVVPALFMAPMGFPVERAEKAVKRYHTQTLAQRASFYLSLPLEEHVAFLKEGELALGDLLARVSLPNRSGALVPPPFPPYFNSLDRERRARMVAQAEKGELRERIRQGWLPLFHGPPPPSWIPAPEFGKMIDGLMAARMKNVIAAVAKLRARGGNVVFVRFPYTGELKKLEDTATPRAMVWEQLLKATDTSGVWFDDYPELAGFDCPEWSHLTAKDSVQFSKLLAPHLQGAMKLDAVASAKKSSAGGQ